MSRFRPSLLLCAFSFLTLATTARADVVIDSFNNVGAPNPWAVTLSAPGSTTVTETGLAGVVGGVRATAITATMATSTDHVAVQVVPSPSSIFDYSSDSAADGKVSLLYNGGVGGMNADLVQGINNAITIRFLNYDFPGSTPLPVTLTVSDGTTTKTVAENYSQLSPPAGLLAFNFSDPGFSGIDFTAVKSLKFEFDPVEAADFRLNFISATSVPEPSPALLGLVALAGSFAVKRIRGRKS
jgi:hypothetical protein